jgi:hypothetical protein
VSRRARLTAWAALGIALFVYSARHITFTTDITNFMPDGGGTELARLSRGLVHSELARTMADDRRGRAGRSRRRRSWPRARAPEVEWLRSGADRVRRGPPALLPAPALLRRTIRTNARRLPISPLLRRIAPEDPLGAFPALLERMRAGEPPLARDGVFTTRAATGQ